MVLSLRTHTAVLHPAAALILIAASAFLACSQKSMSISSGTSVSRSADATERFVIAVPEDEEDALGMTICAEPSPDALAVLGASLAASATVPEQVAASLAGSFSESASSIGLRTQTIQLLRDAMYRLCEAYAGDALTDDQFQLLHSQYQGVMLGLLAIEQLTGAVVARPATIHVSGSASAGGQLAATQREIDAARDRLVALEKTLPTLKAESEQATAALTAARGAMSAGCRDIDPTNVPADGQACKAEPAFAYLQAKHAASANATRALQAAQDKVRQNTDLIARLEEHREAQASGSVTTTGAGEVPSVPSTGTIDQHTAETIGKSVQAIVSAVLKKDYTADQCFILQVGLPKKLKKISKLEDQEARTMAIFALRAVIGSCIGDVEDDQARQALINQFQAM